MGKVLAQERLRVLQQCRRHAKLLGAIAIAVAAIGSQSCGGGGSDGTSPPPETVTYGPNSGIGSLVITQPPLSGSLGPLGTSQTSIHFSGFAFTPAASSCAAPNLPPSYSITWTDSSSGQAGAAGFYLSCFIDLFLAWEIDVPLALGLNSITVTASDGAGNVGRATISVNRM